MHNRPTILRLYDFHEKIKILQNFRKLKGFLHIYQRGVFFVYDRRVPCDPRTSLTEPSHEDKLSDKFRVINLYARTILNKTTDLECILASYNPQVTVITETWLHQCLHKRDILPPVFGIIRKDRNTRGGGVAVLFK